MESTAVSWSEQREPDVVRQIGGTAIKIFAPAPMTEQERKARHDALVQAVANCIASATPPQPTA